MQKKCYIIWKCPMFWAPAPYRRRFKGYFWTVRSAPFHWFSKKLCFVPQRQPENLEQCFFVFFFLKKCVFFEKSIMLDHYVNKDFLWLSATPIPRSLHLSFLGVAQISTMNSPPLLRKPIQTVVASFSDKLIKHCIIYKYF